MSLENNDIKKIAHLASLGILDADIEPIKKDLSNILELVEKMNQEDTNNIAPLAHPLDEIQPRREDVVTETNQREQFQQIAPETKAGLYIVPQVIDSE